MDNIIWYLYFADVMNGVIETLGAIATISGLAAVVFAIMSIVNYCNQDMEEPYAKIILKCLKKTIAICVIALTIGILFPSTRTIYASIGLRVVEKTETGQIITDDVKSILQDVKTIIHKQAEK